MSESLNRASRTVVQGTVAGALVEFIDAFAYDMSDRQYGAAIVLLTMTISYVQTFIEDKKGAGLLRDDLA
jgi:hypothetical protein